MLYIIHLAHLPQLPTSINIMYTVYCILHLHNEYMRARSGSESPTLPYVIWYVQSFTWSLSGSPAAPGEEIGTIPAVSLR